MPRMIDVSRHRFYVPHGQFHVRCAHLKVLARHFFLILRTVNPTAPHFNLQTGTVVLAPSSLSRARGALKSACWSRESAVRSFPLGFGRVDRCGVRL